MNLLNMIEKELIKLRYNLTNMKIAVGFGISSLEQAQYIGSIADGVIIGSKLVSTLELYGLSAFEDKATAFADTIHGDVL